jgi:hypothetical protein
MGVDSYLNAIGIRNNGANPMIRPYKTMGTKKCGFSHQQNADIGT